VFFKNMSAEHKNHNETTPYELAQGVVLGMLVDELEVEQSDLVETDDRGCRSLRPTFRKFGSTVAYLVQEAAGSLAGIRISDKFDPDNFSVSPIIEAVAERQQAAGGDIIETINNHGQPISVFARTDTNADANHSMRGKYSRRNDELRSIAEKGTTRCNRKWRRNNPV
jgi:hypothetical protein